MTENQKPNNIILEAVVGSHAHGLATDNSDIDVMGLYMNPIEKVLGYRYNQRRTSIVNSNPDWTYYEVGNYFRLLASGNPTVNELLYLEDYSIQTDKSKLILDSRHIFLSEKAIKNSYIGYAKSQMKKIGKPASLKAVVNKPARHCFRLLNQAKNLLSSGSLQVKLSKSDIEELNNFLERPYKDMMTELRDMIKAIEAMESVLPKEPDHQSIDRMLTDLRLNE